MRNLVALALALTVIGSGVAAAQATELPKYSFTVEFEGKSLGTFRSVSGLSVETEIIEYRDGTSRTTLYFPGNTKYTTVKLTRAFTGDSALWDWYTTSVQTGYEARFTGTITVFDRSGSPVAQYKLINAWPQKIEGPVLNADSNEVPIESIEIAHEGLQLIRPGAPR
jgi:phage tail-like protein